MYNIFVSPHPPFIPIIKQFAKEYPGDVTFWTISQQWQKALSDLELPAKPISSVLTEQMQHHSFRESLRVINSLKTSSNGVLTEITSTWLDNNLPSYLYNRLPDAINIMQIFDAVGMNLILLHNDVEPIMRLCAMYGRARGIPCLHVPHAVYLDNNDRGPVNSDIHDVITAANLAVAGPYQADWYITRAKEQQIKVEIRATGLPQFDRLAGANRDRAHACRLLNLDQQKPIVAYCSSWRQDTNLLGCYDGIEETFAAFLSAAQQLSDVQFVVSTHPRAGNFDWHVKQIKESGVPIVALPGVHFDTLLNAADLLISYGPSNVILEAACVPDVRLAVVGGGGGFDDDQEVSKMQPTVDGIAGGIVDSLAVNTLDRSKFAYKYAGPIDGLSVVRIYNWCKELLGKKDGISGTSNC